MENIDYGALYGLLPGEKDFTGVIERLEKNGFIPQHLDEYVKEIKQI